MAGKGDEHLGCREGVAERVMWPVRRQPETSGEVVKRGPSAPAPLLQRQEPAELLGVENRLAEAYPLSPQHRGEERLLDPGGVRHEYASGHGGDERLDRLVERRRLLEIDSADPVDEHRLLAERASGPAQPVEGAAGDDPPGVYWDSSERDDLVAPGIEPAQLEVDDAIAGTAPWGRTAGDACVGVLRREGRCRRLTKERRPHLGALSREDEVTGDAPLHRSDCAEGILADDFDLRPVNQAVEP